MKKSSRILQRAKKYRIVKTLYTHNCTWDIQRSVKWLGILIYWKVVNDKPFLDEGSAVKYLNEICKECNVEEIFKWHRENYFL